MGDDITVPISLEQFLEQWRADGCDQISGPISPRMQEVLRSMQWGDMPVTCNTWTLIAIACRFAPSWSHSAGVFFSLMEPLIFRVMEPPERGWP
ncbi:MAG: hypothetical protein JWN04_3835 [Myxococcaceae bacterium]|nr:hypothetical protein [Myxococcaceae bacterium]